MAGELTIMEDVRGAARQAAVTHSVWDHLNSCPLFDGVDEENKHQIEKWCSVMQTYRGETLMEEGARADEVIFIIEGRASVRVESISPYMEISLTRLNAGEILGETALFGQKYRYATIVSEEPGLMLMIKAKPLLEFLQTHPEAGVKVLSNAGRAVARRLRRANQRMVNMVSRRHMAQTKQE